MSNDWQKDKAWSDRFLPEIKRILGEHLIGEPPAEEDVLRNADLMVLRMEAVRIGCRVRTHSYLERYPNEFTIRSVRPKTGNKTELSKILEGWGDYFFYGFSDVAEVYLAAWLLGDLKVFRLWFQRETANLPPRRTPGQAKDNHDGKSSFLAFRVDDLPTEFVVARQLAEGPTIPMSQTTLPWS